MQESKERKLKKTAAEKFDDVIGFAFPGAALRRKRSRFLNNQIDRFALSSYKGASRDRLHNSWIPGGGSADADILTDLANLRERSRDLNRNDGHAAGITLTMTTNTVGTGIRPQSNVDYESLGLDEVKAEEFQKKAERAFQKWMPFADSTDRLHFFDIQQLIDRQILENGEVILIPLRLQDGYRPYSLALEIVESDRLDTPSDKRSDKSIRNGVKLGARGEPVSYFIRKTHPGDMQYRVAGAQDFIEIPARNSLGRKNILHLYPLLRAGQTRGVPFFAPVLTYFKDKADYMEAELVAARIAACFGVLIKQGNPYGASVGASEETNISGQRLESLEPGMLERLGPGEDITQIKPEHPGETFDPFMTQILRLISSGLGLPYELVAKDFSKVNYSSARAALLQAYKYFRYRQGWLTRYLCQPVWDMVIEEAYLKGDIDAPQFYKNSQDWTRARWVPDGWEWVDPLKEVKAQETAMQNNITSLADVCASQGRDYEEVLKQRAREKVLEKKYGLEKPVKEKGATSEPEGTDKNNDKTDTAGTEEE
jgi:lambda family phage portal protein